MICSRWLRVDNFGISLFVYVLFSFGVEDFVASFVLVVAFEYPFSWAFGAEWRWALVISLCFSWESAAWLAWLASARV